jgi:hypothetical protein
MMTMSTLRRVSSRNVEMSPFMALSMTNAAVTSSWRSATTRVVVSQCPEAFCRRWRIAGCGRQKRPRAVELRKDHYCLNGETIDLCYIGLGHHGSLAPINWHERACMGPR